MSDHQDLLALGEPIRQLSTTLRTVSGSLDTLYGKLGRLAEVDRETETATGLLTQLQQDVSRLEQTISASKSLWGAEQSEYQERLQSLRTEMDKVQGDRDRLESEARVSRTSQERALQEIRDRHEKDIVSLKGETASLEHTRDTVRRELDALLLRISPKK